MRDTRASIDSLLDGAIALASRALVPEGREAGYVVAGQAHLLDTAHGDNMPRLRELFEAFQQQKDLLHLMERSARAEAGSTDVDQRRTSTTTTATANSSMISDSTVENTLPPVDSVVERSVFEIRLLQTKAVQATKAMRMALPVLVMPRG